MFNMFPDEDRFGKLFRRLLPVGALLSVPLLLTLGILVFLGRESIDCFGRPLTGFWGLLVCLLLIPIGAGSFALAGAVQIYIGRRIPGLRIFYPRLQDKKNERDKHTTS